MCASLDLVGMFVFVETLVHPSAKYGGSSNASSRSMLIIFLTFTGLAVAFWAWFRFERWNDHHNPAAPDQPVSAPRRPPHRPPARPGRTGGDTADRAGCADARP